VTTHNRWCRTCGWKGTYDTAKRGDYAKRKHSCQKWTAKLAGQQRLAERMANVDRTPKPCLHKEANHQHGTRAAYVLDRCRCLPCSKANATAETQRERQKAYGRYDKYVDAAPVRAHVLALGEQGMGLKRVAKTAGVSTGTLSKLVFGVYADTGTGGGRNGEGTRVRQPSKRMLRTTAEKVLAVELALADGAQVDATGTTRRVRALVALGWSQSKIAERLGIARSNFHLAKGTRPRVLAATAKAVAELYDELSMTIPPAETHRDKISVSRARRYAKQRHWLPPLALDDELLDDPTYKVGSLLPDVDDSTLDEAAIYRRTHGDRNVRLTKDETAELVRRWQAAGRSLAECERVTGINAHRYLADADTHRGGAA
jgi:transcriptional regulator with XRE-family HTH domain